MIQKQEDGSHKLLGSIDTQNIELLSELGALSNDRDISLDFSGLVSADSVLLAALLDLSRKISAKGGTLTLINLPEKLKALALAYGIESLLKRHYQ